MNRGELSDEQRKALEALDFEDYREHINQVIQSREDACDRWVKQVQSVRKGEGGKTQAEADRRLASLESQYVVRAMHSLRIIAHDSPYEDLAVRALLREFQADENYRIDKLTEEYPTWAIEQTSENLIRDIILPIADPEGRMIYDPDEIILSENEAADLYGYIIRNQANVLLIYKTSNKAEKKRASRVEAAKFLSALGAAAIGAIWTTARSARAMRKLL